MVIFELLRSIQTAFRERMNLCKFSLIVHVFLNKGDKHWALVLKLQVVWKLQNLQLILIGRGYFQVLLFSDEEKGHVWA